MLLELQYRHDDVIVGAKVTAALVDRSSISRCGVDRAAMALRRLQERTCSTLVRRAARGDSLQRQVWYQVGSASRGLGA